jgi:hypothetical protein
MAANLRRLAIVTSDRSAKAGGIDRKRPINRRQAQHKPNGKEAEADRGVRVHRDEDADHERADERGDRDLGWP